MKNILLALFLLLPAAAIAQITEPAQQPAQMPVQQPAQQPAEQPAQQQPEQQPVQQPAQQQPAQQPAQQLPEMQPQGTDSIILIPPVQYKFGYVNYRAIFESLPEYAAAQKSLADIKAKYDSETLHNEEEFRRMYLDFLQGQKDFPQTIMLKRQKELQNAMERGIKFRNEVSQMLDNAQKELEAPIIARLDSAIKLVATEKGYEFIMNTDAHAFPFINPTLGEDVTGAVMQKLQTIKEWIPNQNPQPAAQ